MSEPRSTTTDKLILQNSKGEKCEISFSDDRTLIIGTKAAKVSFPEGLDVLFSNGTKIDSNGNLFYKYTYYWTHWPIDLEPMEPVDDYIARNKSISTGIPMKEDVYYKLYNQAEEEVNTDSEPSKPGTFKDSFWKRV